MFKPVLSTGSKLGRGREGKYRPTCSVGERKKKKKANYDCDSSSRKYNIK
jgi:hypothetical protein